MITVGVVESLFGNITTQREGARLLLGIDRDDGRSETLVIRNDGNIPLTGDIGAMLFDDEGDERTDWSVDVSPDTVTNLGVGETLDVVITLMPKENVERGVGLLTINLSGSDEVITQLELEVSVSTAFGSGGLWDVLPEGANFAIAALLVVGLVAAGARMKRSGRLIDDGTELVSPNTHTDPDLLGQRRDEALDLGSSVDELTSGEVSDEEIAKAIMQSMDMPVAPATPPSGLPPAGLPPTNAVPLGLPPAGMPPSPSKALPALPQAGVPAPAPVVAPPVVPAAPPLPPGGLPVGWTMEQWQHYGHEWLRRHG